MTSRCHAAISWREKHSKQRLKDENCLPISAWASAHRGKWGQLTPWKNAWKIKNRKHKSSFLNILRAIRAGRCRERHYADHIFIQIYFRMHHFVVKFSQFSLPQAAVSDPPKPKSCGRSCISVCLSHTVLFAFYILIFETLVDITALTGHVWLPTVFHCGCILYRY